RDAPSHRHEGVTDDQQQAAQPPVRQDRRARPLDQRRRGRRRWEDGTRVSNNLNLTDAPIYYVEASEAGQQRLAELGREVTALEDAAKAADVVILAVPDVVLGKISEQVVPLMKDRSVLLTLDPAAAYAGLLTQR